MLYFNKFTIGFGFNEIMPIFGLQCFIFFKTPDFYCIIMALCRFLYNIICSPETVLH